MRLVVAVALMAAGCAAFTDGRRLLPVFFHQGRSCCMTCSSCLLTRRSDALPICGVLGPLSLSFRFAMSDRMQIA